MPYFQAFQPFSVTVTFFMNSITFVMNHLFSYFDISICHSSNRTLSYRLLLTHGFNHGYVLGGACYIHLSMRTKERGTKTPLAHFSIINLLWQLPNRREILFGKIDIPLHPDNPLKAPANSGFPVKVFFVNTHFKNQIIAIKCHDIDLFLCQMVCHLITFYNLR